MYDASFELSAVTDPNLVYDLRAKLDATGIYDDFERTSRVCSPSAGARGLSAARRRP